MHDIPTLGELDCDGALQEAAEKAARQAPRGVSAAVVAVDPRSGAVRALYNGGRDGPAPFDVATKGRRQAGSAFKPLAAAVALEAGMPDSQMLVGDGPVEFFDPGARKAWRVENFDGEDFGPIGLREALVGSVNTAFAQLAGGLGTGRIATMAGRLGIDVEAALGPPAERGPSIALGALSRGVSPLELASAYGTFAAGGRRAVTHVIESVSGPDGQPLYRHQPASEVALDPAVNGALVDMLQQVVEEGTGRRAQLPGWSPLGKTGTSEGGADAWFVGAVPILSTAVWVGNPASEEPADLTGATQAVPIWRRFMVEALAGERPVAFPPAPAMRSAARPLPLPQPRRCDMGEACAPASR